MKLFLSTTLFVLLSTSTIIVDAGITTCAEQSPCLDYTITKVSDNGCFDGGCEYQVCWRQVLPSENDKCTKDGTISHIGDMAKSEEDGKFCPHHPDFPTWDPKCYAPAKGFDSVCQNVKGGDYARLLVKDAASCSAGGGATFDGDLNTFAQCYPSTDDPNAPGGATYDSEKKKGTCSGNGKWNR